MRSERGQRRLKSTTRRPIRIHSRSALGAAVHMNGG